MSIIYGILLVVLVCVAFRMWPIVTTLCVIGYLIFN